MDEDYSLCLDEALIESICFQSVEEICDEYKSCYIKEESVVYENA